MQVNRLHASEGKFPRSADFNVVACSHEKLTDVAGKPALQVDVIWRLALPTGRFNRFLKIHLKVKKIAQGLGKKLGLTKPSRRADGKNG